MDETHFKNHEGAEILWRPLPFPQPDHLLIESFDIFYLSIQLKILMRLLISRLSEGLPHFWMAKQTERCPS
jgi:hypothetical protein